MADRNMTTKKLWGQFMLRNGMALMVMPDDEFDLGAIPQDIDFHQSDSAQKLPRGSKLIWGEKVMRYYLNDGTLDVVGNLYQMEVPVAGHIDEAIDTPAVGDTDIAFTPTSTDIVVDEYNGGYLHINDDTGEGYMYRVKDNPAITAAASGTITLYDPIAVAPGADATATLFNSPWRAPIIHPSPPTAMVVGWAQSPTVASDWGWLCVAGPTPALIDGTVIISEQVVPSDGTDGAVEPGDAAITDGTPPTGHGELRGIGVVIVVNADTEYGAIWASIPGMA